MFSRNEIKSGAESYDILFHIKILKDTCNFPRKLNRSMNSETLRADEYDEKADTQTDLELRI